MGAPDWEQIAGAKPPVDEDAVMAEVAEFVGQHGAKVPAPVRAEPWRIKSLGEADWAMRRLAEAEARVQQYRDEVALWNDALRRIESAEQFFHDRLTEWALAERTKDRKSFPLAHGTVSTREQGEAIEVVDEDAIVTHAESSADLAGAVKVTKKWSLAEMKNLEHPPRIVDMIVAFEAISKETGETETLEVEPSVFTQSKLDAVVEAMGDGYQVTAITERAVVDRFGGVVPGLAVRPKRVTAHVTVSHF